MKTIPLTQGQFALVDEEDFDRLNEHKWCAMWNNKLKSFYAVRNIRLPNGRCTMILMHRAILGLERGDKRQVDHKKSGDTLNNQKSNLRIVSSRGNMWNLRNQSRFGACIQWRPERSKKNPFEVRVKTNNIKTYVGVHPTLFDAILARDEYLSKNCLN